MTQTIARLYNSQDTATAAQTELKQWGFSDDAIHVVARPEAQETPPPDDGTPADPALQSITKAGVAPEHARIYAEGVHRGEVLVAVEAPFGTALTATNVLESFKPIPVTLPEIAPRSTGGVNGAAPLSAALGIPVLLSDPTPLSNALKWRPLKPEPASSKTLESIQKQSDDPAPLSRKIGMQLLSNDPAPLSNKVGMRTLLDMAAPLSQKLGWRPLLDDPAPLSAKTGMPVLSDNPAPLSSRFGWRLLSNNPAPLSSLLGVRVLSKDQR